MLETSLGLDRIVLETKSVETGLLLKGRLENLIAVLQSTIDRGPEIVDGVASSGGSQLAGGARALAAGGDEEERGGDGDGDESSRSEQRSPGERDDGPASQGEQQAAGEDDDGPASRGEDDALHEEMRKSYESARAALAHLSSQRLNEELREAYESARAAYLRLGSGESPGDASEEEEAADMSKKDQRHKDEGSRKRAQAVATGVAKTVPATAAGVLGGLLLSRVGRRRSAFGRLPISSLELPGRSRGARRLAKQVRKALP